tara:strand:- start:399 stop:1382 length:984 start_codon:yes stop_codon:yes gene_type:complete
MLKKTRLYLSLKNIFIVVLLLVVFDFIYTNINKALFSFDFENVNSKIHGNFKKNIKEYYKTPIHGKTLFCTDNNGFRNNCNKSNQKNFDYLLIGNIFTEGIDLDFEDTYAGIIEDTNKHLKFANLGNRSLNLLGIEKKISNIIDEDYVSFKKVIIFIGPRFFQDNKDNINTTNKIIKTSIKKRIMDNFFYFNNFYHWILFKINKNRLWAYSKNNHYTKDIKIKKTFVKSLENIYKKLKDNNKSLSIVIYPYPNHFIYKNYDTKLIKELEEFCEIKCSSFIDMMEVFNLKVKNGNLWRSINKIYLPYSVHFNRYGNKLIANEVTENLK